mgnify:CR=1 FL=1
MTVLVDEATWPGRGSHWAHLVSDESFDELHELARRLGKRRLGFQGDHYDIDAADRVRALALGVEAVDSRDLVRRLRASGLRRRHPKPSWVRLAVSEVGSTVGSVHDALGREGHAGVLLSRCLDAFGAATSELAVGAFGDPSRVVLLVDVPPARPMVGLDLGPSIGPVEIVVGEPRRDGERSVELFAGR